MFGKIKYRANKQLHFARNVGKMLYGSLAKVNNMTSDSLYLYLKLYSVNNLKNWRFMKSKMLSIFKPGSGGSSQHYFKFPAGDI